MARRLLTHQTFPLGPGIPHRQVQVKFPSRPLRLRRFNIRLNRPGKLKSSQHFWLQSLNLLYIVLSQLFKLILLPLNRFLHILQIVISQLLKFLQCPLQLAFFIEDKFLTLFKNSSVALSLLIKLLEVMLFAHIDLINLAPLSCH